MVHAADTLSPPTSIPDLLSRWKTFREFADEIGCGYEAVRKFRDRESIPPSYWEAIISAAERKGIPGVNWEWLGRENAKTRS